MLTTAVASQPRKAALVQYKEDLTFMKRCPIILLHHKCRRCLRLFGTPYVGLCCSDATATTAKALLVTSGVFLGGAYSHIEQNPEDWEKSKLGLTRSAGELIDAKAWNDAHPASGFDARRCYCFCCAAVAVV